jgi:hypothetical protein
MLHKDWPARVQLEKISGRGSQGAWRQDELIGGKPPVVSNFAFSFDWSTSTVALRVEGGDENGTQCLGV